MIMLLMIQSITNIRDAVIYYSAFALSPAVMMITVPLHFFCITSSCYENYDDAFPASQTSYFGINSHDNEHLVGFYKKCPRCVETWARKPCWGHFILFARLRCIAVDAKRGLCVIASSSREVSCYPGMQSDGLPAVPLMMMMTAASPAVMMMHIKSGHDDDDDGDYDDDPDDNHHDALHF